VYPNPTVVATPNGAVDFCQGDSVVLTGSGAVNFVWHPTNQQTTSISVKDSGSYYTVGTDANGCVGTSNTIHVTISPKANVSINPLSTICLTAAPVKLVGTPPGGTFSGPGVSNDMFDPSVAGVGTWTIKYKYTASGFCTASAEVSTLVTVSPQASVTIDISPTIGC